MIIFGVKTTESTASAGMFPCPRCQTSQGYRCLELGKSRAWRFRFDLAHFGSSR